MGTTALAKLVSALVDGEHDGALPEVLPSWMRRIAEALVVPAAEKAHDAKWGLEPRG